MKSFGVVLKRVFFGVLLLIGLYGIVFYLASLIPVTPKQVSEKHDTVQIYLSSNGVHTDFIIPVVHPLQDFSQVLGLNVKGKPWIAVGWGDKEFYLNTPQWSDLKASTALKALTGLSTSAIHVTQLSAVSLDSKTVELQVSYEAYKALVRYVLKSFQYDKYGKGILLNAPGYGLNDYFYQAKGSYSAFYTCNTWINQGLKYADQKAALWTLTDSGILRHYRKTNE